MNDDYEKVWASKEWKEYARRAHDELHPKIKDSAITVQLFSDEPDPKVAIELGYSLLLGKPLLILKHVDHEVPVHLGRIAEGVLEFRDGELGTSEFAERMYAEVDRILKDRGESL